MASWLICHILLNNLTGRKRRRKHVNDCYSMDSCTYGFETRCHVKGKASKTVHVCYSMGLSACGCETRASPSNSLATTALFTSWNNANVLNVFSALSSTLNKMAQQTINTMSNDIICFNKKEALRYFRAQPGDAQAEAAIDSAYEKLRNELQPRYTVKEFGCCVCTEGDSKVPSVVALDNGTVFHSKALARYVGKSTELFLFGATLGSRVDITLRRLSLTSVAEAGAGQAVAAALIETYCDDCCNELQKQLPEGKQLKWRFSPGYGDWPLEEQKILFSVLDCAHSIGLTLTESCMMAPIKSVTAVIAVEDVSKNNHSKKVEEKEKIFLKNFNCNQNEKTFSNSNNKCLRCNKVDCEFRKK